MMNKMVLPTATAAPGLRTRVEISSPNITRAASATNERATQQHFLQRLFPAGHDAGGIATPEVVMDAGQRRGEQQGGRGKGQHVKQPGDRFGQV